MNQWSSSLCTKPTPLATHLDCQLTCSPAQAIRRTVWRDLAVLTSAIVCRFVTPAFTARSTPRTHRECDPHEALPRALRPHLMPGVAQLEGALDRQFSLPEGEQLRRVGAAHICVGHQRTLKAGPWQLRPKLLTSLGTELHEVLVDHHEYAADKQCTSANFVGVSQSKMQ